MQLRQHIATLTRQAAAEMGDAVIGVVIIHRGYDMRVRPINGRWSARSVLEDIGNDHADVVEEWGDTWSEAADKVAEAADKALGR